jgi:general secretion pathway protein G
MRYRPRRTARRRPAFTLIEMIAVLVIIGLIVGIGVPAYMNYIESSRQQSAQAQTRLMSDSAGAFNMHVGRYPTEEEGLLALIQRPTDADGWNGPYIQNWKAIPKDPWGGEYLYQLQATESGRLEPHVVSLGSDREPGGTGMASDIVNGQIYDDADLGGL